MGIRKDWDFEVPASELRGLAQKKVDHHRSRVTYYEGERERLQEEYVESVRKAADKAADKEAEAAQEWLSKVDMHSHSLGETVAYANATPQLRGGQPTVVGDAYIYQDLQRAQSKIQEHVTKIGTYTRWVALLGRAPDDCKLAVDIEDAHFFDLTDG